MSQKFFTGSVDIGQVVTDAAWGALFGAAFPAKGKTFLETLGSSGKTFYDSLANALGTGLVISLIRTVYSPLTSYIAEGISTVTDTSQYNGSFSERVKQRTQDEAIKGLTAGLVKAGTAGGKDMWNNFKSALPTSVK